MWLPSSPDVVLAEASQVDGDVVEEWFRSLYDSPVLFSGLLDGEGRVIGGNQLAIEGCGFVREQVIGAPFWEGGWWSADRQLAEQLRGWCENCLSTRQPFRTVTRYFRGDGSTGMVDLSLAPIVASDDQATVHVVATGLDISELLAAQAEREDALVLDEARVRSAGERFRSALDAMLDQVVIARSVRDGSGEIVDFEIEFMNQAAFDVARRSPGEMLGQRVCDLYPSWRTSGMFDTYKRVVDTGEPFVAERMAYEDARDDGKVVAGCWDLQIVRLDDGYIAASRDVTEVVQNEETARRVRAIAERERLIVEVLQRAALPDHLPSPPGITISAHHQAANTQSPVGGDWYDAFGLHDGRVALVIADVAGHGPESAAYTVQVRNMLRAAAMQANTRVDAILGQANRMLIELHGRDAPFVTCCLAILDPRTREIEWSLAGHPEPIIQMPSDDPTPTCRPSLPLGLLASAAYHHARLTLEEGSRIVMYTDGLIERRGSTIDEDVERLRIAVARSQSMPAELVSEELVSVLSPGDDDVAVLVVDIDPR